MPIYEFKCNQCNKIKEVIILGDEEEPKKCECGGDLKKLVSHSSFHLKGTGWYKTDYVDKVNVKPT